MIWLLRIVYRVTGRCLRYVPDDSLWAPREKGHAAAHKGLWAAYREYEAACPLTVSPAPTEDAS